MTSHNGHEQRGQDASARVGQFLRDEMSLRFDASRRLAEQRAQVLRRAAVPGSGRWSLWSAERWLGAGGIRQIGALAVVSLLGLVVFGGALQRLGAPSWFEQSRGWGLGANALVAEANGSPVTSGQWLTADDEVERLGFSDGTEVSLAAHSRARLTQVGRAGASFVLERGLLNAEVVPETGYRWTFRAGPYRVVVLGTVLSVEWQPETQRLSVAVSRGKVLVEDERRAESGSIVAAGGRLELTAPGVQGSGEAQQAEKGPRAAAAADSSPPSIEPAKVTSGEVAVVPQVVRGAAERGALSERPVRSQKREQRASRSSTSADEPGTTVPQAASSTAPLTPTREHPSWKTLAQDGLYAESVAAARAVGLDGLQSELSAADLWRLADAARLAGQPSAARQVLQSLRARFPTHANSHTAAYMLGRIAFDARDYRESVSWFRKYLAAGRGGSDEGARARLFMALNRLGERGDAAVAAREYLERYPQGSNAAFARSVVSSKRSSSDD